MRSFGTDRMGMGMGMGLGGVSAWVQPAWDGAGIRMGEAEALGEGLDELWDKDGGGGGGGGED